MEHSYRLKAISYWLFCCCFCVFCMIIVGAITRLTESGLSIVEWKPLIGAIPPLNEAQWQETFDLYKQSPEFQKKNFWMEISDFKQIFFWEWFHRLLGRLIGVVYAVPFLFFLARGWIPSGYRLKLFGVFILGGLQGAMGWYMVKSGLVDNPAVSHYRLAAHLSLAFIIYGFVLWFAFKFISMARGAVLKADQSVFRFGVCVLIAVAVTVVWGAFTAGLDAGLVYNDSFPKMGGRWIPEEVWFHQPIWLNFFENHAGVQFMHRWLAIFTFVVLLSFVIFAVLKGHKSTGFALLGVFAFIQPALGIATLLSGVSLPIAVMHQGGAVILISLVIYCLHISAAHSE